MRITAVHFFCLFFLYFFTSAAALRKGRFNVAPQRAQCVHRLELSKSRLNYAKFFFPRTVAGRGETETATYGISLFAKRMCGN